MRSIQMSLFLRWLFDGEAFADQAAEIGQVILKARSLRLTAIAAQIPATSVAASKGFIL
ncbi:MAG: hypothetical protein RML46_00055 [Anaerolineae bacterium]|nr:hypothetical protein [Anaerolineae bacterium]MDW8067288.1 hypothetical protein [Anaerolineae bacterium]